MCLFGSRNGTREVIMPADVVPTNFPEPTPGINCARKRMEEKDWLSLVAAHSDSWLLSLAFCIAGRCVFGKREREMLFRKINDLPTISEVVRRTKQPKRPSAATRSKANENMSRIGPTPPRKEGKNVGEEEEDDEEAATLCGVCGVNYDGFWICCDFCETWFHGACVKITPAMARQINEYKCPSCGTKRAIVQM